MSEGFQPGGRAPAPPPLDLVQDFVNAEVPDWARDDIATPELLESWLRGRGLLAADERVDAAGFVAARELRYALRALALLNTLGLPPAEATLDELRRALSGVSTVVCSTHDPLLIALADRDVRLERSRTAESASAVASST